MDKNWLDIQHRGFSAYRELTLGKTIPNLQGTSTADTRLQDCIVSTDWIERIELALPYLENAVHQNRQFILRQGQTVPLEKAKRVSRESVEHLAKHSELIAADPQHPERIYISENVDTYSIYENRFLYLLLRILMDFVDSRYQKISTSSCFSSDIQVTRQFRDNHRQLAFQLTCKEVAQGETSPETQDALLRIQRIQQAVEQLLRTDLMKEVAAAPLLNPPIARTNVLLHDPNFREALELYTYLTAYTDQGYQLCDKLRKGNTPELEQSMEELVSITSYLSYCNLLGQELEERRKDALREENRQKLAALRAALGDVNPQALAYLQTLEQQLQLLEQKSQRLEQETRLRQAAQSQLSAANAQLTAIRAEAAQLNKDLDEKNQQIQDLTHKNAQIQETVELRLRHAEHQQEVLRQSFEEKLTQQQQEFQEAYQALGEKCQLADALTRELSPEQDCSKAAFCRLEQQYHAFRRFYRRQWQLTKKQIRKEQLWKK